MKDRATPAPSVIHRSISSRCARHVRARRLVTIVVVAAATLFVGSCASGAPHHRFAKANLHGIVFDLSGTPVAGAEIRIEHGAAVHSDLSGRFVVPHVPAGPIRLLVSREGHERRSVELSFVDRRQIAYVRLASAAELAAVAEARVRANAPGEAVVLARRALAADPRSHRIRFLAASVMVVGGMPEEATEVLAEAWPALAAQVRTQYQGGGQHGMDDASQDIARTLLQAIARTK